MDSGKNSIAMSIRIDLPGGRRFGPGKAALLRAIEHHGSLSAAAQSLGMSYPRAMKLVHEMNTSFREPLVHKQHGGADRGGSTLTPSGTEVLAEYMAICNAAELATVQKRGRLAELINLPPS